MLAFSTMLIFQSQPSIMDGWMNKGKSEEKDFRNYVTPSVSWDLQSGRPLRTTMPF